MRSYYQLAAKVSLALLFLFPTYNSLAQFVSFSDFEADLGIWNDGGSDAFRHQAATLSGSYSIRLRDNSRAGSSIFTAPIDLRGTSNILLSFKYKPESMEPGEDFFIEYSEDGNHYQLIKSYVSGIDFSNDNIYEEAITIERAFSSQSVFRFRCDASTNYDRIFLDNITIADQDCICPTVEEPVCGTNGITYENSCVAECSGVTDYTRGPCDPVVYCEDYLATADFGDLCAQCITEIALYEYQKAAYLVYFPNNVTCADGVLEVRACPSNELFCSSGGLIGPNECVDFFSSAARIKSVAKQNCGCNCPTVFDPVCSIYGQTYNNDCEALCAGVPIASQGECVPFEACEKNLADQDFGDLCAQCISEIVLYEYHGNAYLVYFPDKVNCSDGTTIVRECYSNKDFCKQGGIAGLSECDDFFASAKSVRSIASQDCGVCGCSDVYQPVCGD